MNPEDRVDEYLMHYGVLGMKWGRRKARASNSSEQAPKKRRMSNKELQARIKTILISITVFMILLLIIIIIPSSKSG